MIHLGFGVMISKVNKAKLDAGMKLAERTQPQFIDEISKLTVPRLKALCQKAGIPRAGLRGLTVKQHFIDKLASWHTGECLKAAGYVQETHWRS